MSYNLFISHAWKYDEHYKKIVGWLNDSKIDWKNYSVPEHDPLDAKNTTKLKQSLTSQIRPTSCVIILAGMYGAYSDWIEYEINESVRMGKKIIGVEPWGQEKIPKIVSDNATVMVGWNSSSVVNAIKTQCK